MEKQFSCKRRSHQKNGEERSGLVVHVHVHVDLFIIQQIVTLSKYGHDALDICHP